MVPIDFPDGRLSQKLQFVKNKNRISMKINKAKDIKMKYACSDSACCLGQELTGSGMGSLLR